jgi:hypothetical protein
VSEVTPHKEALMLGRISLVSALIVTGGLLANPSAGGAARGADVRLTHDDPGSSGYVSAYTLATGQAYTDAVLQECSISRGRQNEPAVEVDPRNSNLLIGSSNDYCAVFAPEFAATLGPVWLGYYRSTDGGASFVSSLVPGYPGDVSPFAPLAHIRTFDAGDPVIAWDAEGRVFMGSESDGSLDHPNKENGDEWVARFVNPDGPSGDPSKDGLLYQGTETVAKGAASFGGKFNDKTAIEADRTQSSCRDNVYFSWSRFSGGSTNGFNSSIYFVRSTDHGTTWSGPKKLSQTIHDIQNPDVSVTSNGDIYVTFRAFADVHSQSTDALEYVKSTDCGASFGPPVQITTFEPYDAADLAAPEPIPSPPAGSSQAITPTKSVLAGDCGDFALHCASGYTFFRETTQVRAIADQTDLSHQYVYLVYDPSKPGTEVPTGTSYGTIASGDLPAKYHQDTGSQQAVDFIRLDGATGLTTTPALIDDETVGHQRFPDISIDGGILHALWWDSRLDPSYSAARPIGNDANGVTGPALDVWAATSTDLGATWTNQHRVSEVTTNPNFEQFSNRTVPFAGDYLWITSVGGFSYGVWTDWRDTVQGSDPREVTEDEDQGSADVHQCRTFDPLTGWSADTCPHEGGIDQNIYGDQVS